MNSTLGPPTNEFLKNDLANEARHSGEQNVDRDCLGLGRHDNVVDRRKFGGCIAVKGIYRAQ